MDRVNYMIGAVTMGFLTGINTGLLIWRIFGQPPCWLLFLTTAITLLTFIIAYFIFKNVKDNKWKLQQ
jgi:membrane protein YdbS with pleckstrin-like domain